MSIEDGMRKATKNIDEAAEAAPASELVDENDFGTKSKEADGSKDDDNSENTSDSLNDSDDVDDRADSAGNSGHQS